MKTPEVCQFNSREAADEQHAGIVARRQRLWLVLGTTGQLKLHEAAEHRHGYLAAACGKPDHSMSYGLSMKGSTVNLCVSYASISLTHTQKTYSGVWLRSPQISSDSGFSLKISTPKKINRFGLADIVWTHCFKRIPLSPCASYVMPDRIREECCYLSGCFWLKKDTNVHVRGCSRNPKVCFFPEQSSDGDAGLVLQDVLSSRMFCWAIFGLHRHSKRLSNVS